MTFAIGHVQGGTNAGRRIVKQKPRPWVHVCAGKAGGVELPGYMARCGTCGCRRPS